MNTNGSPPPAPEPLDELVDALLGCGGPLSQMIASMVEFEASGRASPDVSPIPVIAHGLIREVSRDLRHEYSKRDLRTAAKIVNRVTDAICSEILYIPPEALDRLASEEADGHAG